MHLWDTNCIRGPPDYDTLRGFHQHHRGGCGSRDPLPTPVFLLRSEARPVSTALVSMLVFQQPLERSPGACGVSQASAGMRALWRDCGGDPRHSLASSSGPLCHCAAPPPAASGAGALLLILHVGQAADDCRGLWVWCLAARGLSLPGVEDKPRQEASRPRRPLCSPPAGSCQTFPPSRGEWEQLRP